MISLVNQGKFKVGVGDGIFFVLIKWGSLDMSAGANPMNFRPI
jgi:hypothetical protein